MVASGGLPPDLHGVVPALLTGNIAETLSFYESLGFHVTACHPERASATWAEVARGSAILQFHTDAPVNTPGEPAMSGTIYIRTTNLDALAAELRETVSFAWGPEMMGYGAREFGIQDPNGYFLAFSESD